MNQTLDDQSRSALVEYRIKRAFETYDDALDSFKKGSYNSCMNRLYYACFYAVRALLVKNGIEAKSHEGVRRMFGLHYISSHKLHNRFNVYYSQILQARIQGDYDDLFTFDHETAEHYLKDGKEFIETLAKMV